MIASLVVARNGSAAIAFVVQKKIAGDRAHPRVGAFPGAQGLCGSGGRIDHDDDSWPEGGTGPSDPGCATDRLTHIEALAPMVAGTLCPQHLLESGPSPVHAAVVRGDAAFVVVVEV